MNAYILAASAGVTLPDPNPKKHQPPASVCCQSLQEGWRHSAEEKKNQERACLLSCRIALRQAPVPSVCTYARNFFSPLSCCALGFLFPRRTGPSLGVFLEATGGGSQTGNSIDAACRGRDCMAMPFPVNHHTEPAEAITGVSRVSRFPDAHWRYWYWQRAGRAIQWSNESVPPCVDEPRTHRT